MSRMSYTIQSDYDRNRVADLVRTLKDGMRVDIKQAKRSDPQNAKFWAMLNEVADQVVWHGAKLAAEDWKFIFLDAYKREVRVAPSIDGRGFVSLGRSSSDLSVAEMADVITLIEMFGANHGVKFKESNSSGAASSGDRADAPAAESPGPQSVATAAGVSPSNWFDWYVERLTRHEDEPLSLLHRHESAMRDGLGPLAENDPNKMAVLRQAWRLVRDRNEQSITVAEYDLAIAKLRSIAMGTRHAA